MIMTVFDEIAETDGDNEWEAWLERVFASRDEIVTFVAGRREEGKAGEFVRYLKGSFNLSLCIKFNDEGPDAIIRFPKPGHTATALRDEKVFNEVQFMKYLSQNTTIPLPRVIDWGLTEESPQQLGPFIIMDYVDGTRLSTLLKQPTENDQEDVVLNPEIDDITLDILYDQIADYIVQLSELDFNSIGSISEDPTSNTWSVTGRPLTYNMNELATVSGYPIDKFPAAHFASANMYFQNLANEHLIHLQTQRNLADDTEDAQKRLIARHRFRQLIPQYCIEDAGPFKPFCDDLQPSNMLVDPKSLRITAVLDLEFTNTMPAQFAYDPPWWLLLLGPDMWLERRTMEEFLARYKPRMEQFLRALERVEARSEFRGKQADGPRLSTRMRDSWRTGRFWFDYGIRKSFDVDAVYWAALHKGGAGVDWLEEETRAEMESIGQMKMEQLKAYKEECAARFSRRGSI
jgi:Phosphotransferase enzyme family